MIGAVWIMAITAILGGRRMFPEVRPAFFCVTVEAGLVGARACEQQLGRVAMRIVAAITRHFAVPQRMRVRFHGCGPLLLMAVEAHFRLGRRREYRITLDMAVMAVGPQGPGGQQVPGAGESDSGLTAFTSPQGQLIGAAPHQVSQNGVQTHAGQKMNFYLLRHIQVSGTGTGPGFVAYMPAVAENSQANTAEEKEPADDEVRAPNIP